MENSTELTAAQIFYRRHKDDPEFKEKRNKYARIWNSNRTKTDPEYRDKRRSVKRKAATVYYHKHKNENKEYTLYMGAKTRSKNKKLEFNIELSDIIIPSNCSVLGIPLDRNIKSKWADGSPSLDRIDNTKGYIKGNIQIISALANTMKNKATPEQLLKFAHWAIKEYGE